MRPHLRAVCALAIALYPPVEPAADVDRPSPEIPQGPAPKIVLVLSGGGARGAAHVGVLRALEELRVPIHAIVGTSMGAVVGGLYAAGHAPSELDELMRRIGWQDVLVDDPPRRYFRFRRKAEDQNFLMRGGIGISRQGLKLPQGAIHGHRLKSALAQETLHLPASVAFDDLPLALRIVATDLETGRPVILDSGSLVDAMYASLAIPAALAPAEIDGRLLVDGGVSNNLPVDVALGLDADIVIAVNVTAGYRSRAQLQSVLDVTDQLANILTQQNTGQRVEMLRPDDILIEPRIPAVGSVDFDALAETIPLGYEATIAFGGRLRAYGLSPSDYLARTRAIRPDRPESVHVEDIRVVSDSKVDSRVLERRLRLKPGDVDVDAIRDGADEIYGTELFRRVDYEIDDGILTYYPERRDWGPNYLQFGLELSDDFQGRTAYTLGVGLTATELNRRGAEWRMEAVLGDRPRLYNELYQPFGGSGRWFVAPSFTVSAYNIAAFVDGSLLAEYQVRQTSSGLAAGREINPNAEFRIGAVTGQGSRKRIAGGPEFANGSADQGYAYARIAHDSLDNLYFPTAGAAASLEWRLARANLGSDRRYQTLSLRAMGAYSRARHTVVADVDLRSATEGTLPLHEEFSLGGFLNLSGLNRLELRGSHSGVLRAIYYYRVSDNPIAPVFAGGSVELGNVWDERADIDFATARFAGSLFIGVDTAIGPLYLASGVAESGAKSVYVFLGRPF